MAEDAAGGEDDGIIVAGGAEREGAEDAAQSSARSDPAPTEDLLADGEASSPRADRTDERSGQAAGVDDPVAMADRQPPSDGRVVSTPAGEQPDIEELRERLTDQFESIKIVEPGKYELNLMELYDREEYVIALQENGRYVIQVPETWLGEGAEDD